MAEFTVVNPPKRARSQSIDSIRNESSISERAQESATKKQKKAEGSGTESDKENSPKTPGDQVKQSYEINGSSSSVIDWDNKFTFHESGIIIGVGRKPMQDFLYGPSGSLIRDDSTVPEHLRLKKYDTKPPPIPSREQVLAAAERLFSPRNKRALESNYPDSDSEYEDSLGPTPKRRKNENTKHTPQNKPGRTFASPSQTTTPGSMKSDTTPKKTIVDGRTMITTTKIASRMQKLVSGFPLPEDPFPEDFTLTELCTQYPNHIFGDNLHPFLQHEWPATKIAKLLPDQSQVAEKDKVTANAIASRLRKAKLALERLGRYTSLMAAPKTHAELWNNMAAPESTSAGSESEDDEEQTEDDEVSDDDE